MRKIKIPKKTKGEFRTIYQPSKTEKQALREIFPSILSKALNICNLEVCQGFFPNTSPVTNALKHIGYQYTTVFDLKDFFDSVNINHLKEYLTEEELNLVLVDDAPRQGLPTSPIVANLAASKMDNQIIEWIKLTQSDIKYTRYADDLALSYNNIFNLPYILNAVCKIIKDNNFDINDKKTRTMSAKNGRRIITGIAVDETIHPSRRMKRKMRAAFHNKNFNKYNGLKEWCKLKRPNYLVKIEIEELKQKFPQLLRKWSESAYNFENSPLE